MKKVFNIALIVVMLGSMLIMITGCGKKQQGDKKGEVNANNTFNNEESKNAKKNVTITPENYGDKVNYNITVNGVELNDWRIFLAENDKVYIIYGNELPGETLPNEINSASKTSKYKNQIMWSDKKKFIEFLTNADNWNYLLNENLLKNGANAVGALTLEQFVTSYNSKYTKDKFNIITGEKKEDGYVGYTIKRESLNKGTSIDAQKEAKHAEGYTDAQLGRSNELKDGTLYFPNASADTINQHIAYWLSTPADDGTNRGICAVVLESVAAYAGINSACCRPVISIPMNMLEQSTDNTWNIK